MKGSVRILSYYVLQGFLITALLVSLKILAEHTPAGHRVELFTFEALRSTLPSLGSAGELPVAVVDTSDMQGKDGQLIDLAQLKEITAAIVEQHPRAIAIDLVLNPKDISAASQDNTSEPTAQQVQDYYKFLDFCLEVEAKHKVPIFIAVGVMSAGQPKDWLGQEKYKELAATAFINKEDAARMPVWLKAGPAAEKLYSLSASLSYAYTKPRLPDAMSWAIDTTEEGLPGTRRYLEEDIEYADALINFGKLDAVRQNKLLTISGTSVKESGEKFRDKMVLLGDGALEKTMDVFVLPGQREPVPGVYIHACAAHTFAREPLYEMNQTARLVVDACLCLLVFGGRAVARYRHLDADGAVRADRPRGALGYVAGAAILMAAVGVVYWLGLLWLDFLLVAIAVWLHTKFEKLLGRLSKRQTVPAPHETAASDRQTKNTPQDVRQMESKPKHKTRRTLKARRRSILFVAANPTDASRIQTGREHRTIKAEMERGSHRDAFEFLQPQFAVTITELLRAMNTRPNIVHFSGHGSTDGILITKDDNQSQLLTAEVLERLFKPLKDVTELVVLNSCYSASQAESISRLGMYVIGNNLPVGDGAAISFAKGLYNGLSEGKTFEAAVNDARIVVMAEAPTFAAVVEVWAGGNKLDV